MRTQHLFFYIAFFVLLSACGGNTTENETDSSESNADETTNETTTADEGRTPIADGVTELTFTEDDLAPGMYEGEIVTGRKWRDKNGVNIVVFTTKTIFEPWEGDDYADDMGDYTIHLKAYHYADSEEGWEQLRMIKDWNPEPCGSPPFAVEGEFYLESISLTDIDKDEYAEITFMYFFNCASEINPRLTKLMMLENGDKYAIRGNNYIENYYPDSGEKNIDASFNSAPAGFKDFASDLWEKYCKSNPNLSQNKGNSKTLLNAEYLSQHSWNLTSDASHLGKLVPQTFIFTEDGTLKYTIMEEDWIETEWDMKKYPTIICDLEGKLTYEEGLVYYYIADKNGTETILVYE